MKKFIPLILLLVLLTSFVVAEEVVTPSDQDNPLKEKAQEVIEKPSEIGISSGLQSLSNTVFNLDEGSQLTLVQFLLLTLILIFFLLIFHSIIRGVFSFNGAISWITSLVLASVFSILGGVNYVASLIAGFSFEKIGIFTLILWAIGLFILFFILNKIFKKIKQSSRLSKATEEGRVVGTEIAKLKAISDVERIGEDI